MKSFRLCPTVAILIGVCLPSCQRPSALAAGENDEAAAPQGTRVAFTNSVESPSPVASTLVPAVQPGGSAPATEPKEHDPGTPPTLGSPPSGLVAVKPVRKVTAFDPKTVTNPFINGLSIQIEWSTLEPAQGKPDWSKLDELFAAAEASKKWVHVMVYPGFNSPPWALEGAKCEQFERQYGPKKGEIEKLPMPWDDVYLTRWLSFLKALHARFGKSPAFRMIAAAGPTSISAEMTLPQKLQDIHIWKSDGYTPRKYIEAWRRVLQFYATEFPNQYVSLSVGAGIGINDDGKNDSSEPARTRQAVIEQAISIFGRRFVLMNNDLHAGPMQHEVTDLVRRTSGRVLTGLEMRCPAEVGTCSASLGADGDPPNALRRSITKGIEPGDTGQHVNFLEIYEPDVLAAEMQPVLREAASMFERKP
jgi:hypothetical protein